jgi:hypothetical protein
VRSVSLPVFQYWDTFSGTDTFFWMDARDGVALYVLFSHMLVLRRKVFGKGRTLGGGKKRQ